MAQKKVSDLKINDVIIIYGNKAVIRKIETSGKGIKEGRIKCRIEAEFIKDKKPIVFVRLAGDFIETA